MSAETANPVRPILGAVAVLFSLGCVSWLVYREQASASGAAAEGAAQPVAHSSKSAAPAYGDAVPAPSEKSGKEPSKEPSKESSKAPAKAAAAGQQAKPAPALIPFHDPAYKEMGLAMGVLFDRLSIEQLQGLRAWTLCQPELQAPPGFAHAKILASTSKALNVTPVNSAEDNKLWQRHRKKLITNTESRLEKAGVTLRPVGEIQSEAMGMPIKTMATARLERLYEHLREKAKTEKLQRQLAYSSKSMVPMPEGWTKAVVAAMAAELSRRKQAGQDKKEDK